MKGCPQFPELGPLGKSLEVVDRLSGLHFDHRLQTPSSVQGLQHEIRVDRRRSAPDWDILLTSRIDAGLMAPARLQLEQPNDSIMLKLLPDRPNQDWAHRTPPNDWITERIKPGILACFGRIDGNLFTSG